MGSWKDKLLERRNSRQRKTKIDEWIERNPKRSQDMLELMQDFIECRQDAGTKISFNDLTEELRESFGLELSPTSVIQWMRREYPDAQEYLIR